MNKATLRRNLSKAYGGFFREMGIDPDTGCLDLDSERKFANYPYVGSKYGKYKTTKKVLFVGLDIGKDPKPGRVQSFPERRTSIEDKSLSCHNRHIAGTYMTVLYFLKEQRKWGDHWKEIVGTDVTCEMVLKKHDDLLPPENPLSYCALTNYYKFVTKGREKRGGAEDRIHLNREAEIRLFIEELEAFDPKIVIFQGPDFQREFEREGLNLNKKGRSCYVAPHPSYREKNGRKPSVYVGKIQPLG